MTLGSNETHQSQKIERSPDSPEKSAFLGSFVRLEKLVRLRGEKPPSLRPKTLRKIFDGEVVKSKLGNQWNPMESNISQSERSQPQDQPLGMKFQGDFVWGL